MKMAVDGLLRQAVSFLLPGEEALSIRRGRICQVRDCPVCACWVRTGTLSDTLSVQGLKQWCADALPLPSSATLTALFVGPSRRWRSGCRAAPVSAAAKAHPPARPAAGTHTDTYLRKRSQMPCGSACWRREASSWPVRWLAAAAPPWLLLCGEGEHACQRGPKLAYSCTWLYSTFSHC